MTVGLELIEFDNHLNPANMTVSHNPVSEQVTIAQSVASGEARRRAAARPADRDAARRRRRRVRRDDGRHDFGAAGGRGGGDRELRGDAGAFETPAVREAGAGSDVRVFDESAALDDRTSCRHTGPVSTITPAEASPLGLDLLRPNSPPACRCRGRRRGPARLHPGRTEHPDAGGRQPRFSATCRCSSSRWSDDRRHAGDERLQQRGRVPVRPVRPGARLPDAAGDVLRGAGRGGHGIDVAGADAGSGCRPWRT